MNNLNISISRGVGIKWKDHFLVPPDYDSIKPAMVDGKESDNIFITSIDGKLGYVRVNAKTQSYKRIDPIYAFVGEFINDLSISCISYECRTNTFELINTNLDKISDGELFDCITRTANGYYIIQKNGFCGVLNSTGKEIVACKFKSIKYDECTRKFEMEISPQNLC